MKQPRQAGQRRRVRLAALTGLVTALVGFLAAPAMAASTVEAVTIDCVGDSVSGHVGIQDPDVGKATVTLYGRAGGGAWTSLGTRTVTTAPDVFEIAYTFTVEAHKTEYRVEATIGSSSKFSQIIHDRTCQPPAEVPEAGIAAAVPAVMGVAGGAVWWLRRRRTVTG